jgi:beta-fructofuranosidase
MNDPNGLVHWNGRYHLFYQHNPFGPLWGNMHWGHAVSDDLVHWDDLPIALAPTPGGPDQDGCFSGCFVDHDGRATLMYTGVRRREQRPCLATSDDPDLRVWRKHPGNPVIPEPPPGLELTGFRDHAVWKEGDTWYQIVGAGIEGVGGTALLYRSPDLLAWDYLHPILTGDKHRTDPFWTGTMWECPDLFPLGNKHVLVASVWDKSGVHSPHTLNHAVYFLGSYADHRFVPETEGILDVGGHFYAPQTTRDARGRRLMWGWLWEGRDPAAIEAAGWAGVMSLPRVLSLRPDGALGVEPVPELAALRGAHRRWRDLALAPGAPAVLDETAGDCIEIRATFAPTDAVVGLALRRTPDGAEETRVRYDRRRGLFALDGARASLDVGVDRAVDGAPLTLAPDEPLELRVFLDRSVVEVFANGRLAVSDRIYPSRPDALGLAAFAEGEEGRLASLDAWRMAPIWPTSE